MSEMVDALASQGGILADSVRALDGQAPCSAPLSREAAGGPRAAGRESDYELMLEMILEGSRLHYGAPRFVHADDPDLALLLGDQLYALGLARLAALGDLEAVAELADVISLVAQAHAAADPGLADAIWQAGASAIGWGAADGYVTAKSMAREQDPGAQDALQRATQPVLREAAVS
jgi:hypothetical protein